MEYRPLSITVISADDLKDVNLMSKMDVYVIVSISGDSRSKSKTPIHRNGGTSPKWNHTLNLSVVEPALAQNPNLSLLFQIKSDRALGDKDIGEVSVLIRELLDNPTVAADEDGGSERVVDYQVRTSSGRPKGTLKFSYRFGEKTEMPSAPALGGTKSKKFEEPVTAYPMHAPPPPPGVGYAMPPPGMGAPYPPPQGYDYSQPPPQHGGYPYVGDYPPPQGYPPAGAGPGQAYGYAPPPPQYGGYPPAGGPGYGYAPPLQMGYGYAPPSAVKPGKENKKKKGGSKFGMGMGLGAGLLGGMLVGDMISDVGEMAAYDAAAGFDF